MPKIYSKRERKRLHNIDLEKIKNKLHELGYQYVRDGGFREDDEPFEFCNYIFYEHPETKQRIRIGYDIYEKYNSIFEICYANKGQEWYNDILPDYRKNIWKSMKKS